MKLVTEGHPSLDLVCPPYDFGAADIDPPKLARELIEVMIQEGGRGLAAPQVARTERVFVMKRGETVIACFNPEIVKASKVMVYEEEGCLSFPGMFPRVGRAYDIVARWQDERGNVWDADLKRIDARCFQHELDHLDGKTLLDRAAAVAITLARKNAAARRERQGRPAA